MASSDYSKSYQLEFRPQGVYITLAPDCFDDPDAAGREIIEQIIQRRIDSPDLTVVERMLKERATDARVLAAAQPEPIDGKAVAQVSPDKSQALLKVTPPMGKGRKATVEDALRAMQEAGAGDFFFDHDKIETIVNTFKFRDFVPVGERRDGKAEVHVSKDATDATLTLYSAYGGSPVTLEDVKLYLRNEGITHGIKLETIQKMLAEGIYNQAVTAVVGQKTLDGENARLEFFFDPQERKARPTIDDEGNVDFYELNVFSRARVGDPLVRKYPATPGINGMTIRGEEIPARAGKDLPFPGGINTKTDKADPNLVIAGIDGQPRFQSNKVHVIPIIEVRGDVDFSTGNIDFTGSVNISGNIIGGFTVKAMGDIQVGGCVESAVVEAGGSIHIRQGIVGQDAGVVMARGNITAKFIDKATVYAEGDIYVDESIMYSRVSSAGEIHLVGKKGYIIGGVTRASKAVYSHQIGTPIQTPTVIEVGGSPSLREELEKTEKEITEIETRTEMQTKSIDTIEKRRSQGVEDKKTKDRALQLSRERFALMSRLRAFQEKKEDIEEKLSRLHSQSLKVHVKQKIFPSTKLIIKNAVWISQDAVEFASFHERDGEILFAPYEGGREDKKH